MEQGHEFWASGGDESRDVIPRYEMLCAEAKHLECPQGDILLRRAVLWTERHQNRTNLPYG
ncbi:MAG: hypothetical protein JWN14_3830 [Chthonomonadales bacterium]|nr:hypothetical protein [Chthonomonadales bacterium]